MADRQDVETKVITTLTWLKRRGTRRNRDGMARYAIVADKAFGVSMGTMQTLARTLRDDHDLALALWETGWYEARMLATLIDDPARVTSAQMEKWCRDFDNWAICDTACFKLFDRVPLAWKKVRPWSRRRAEYEKRAAFALIASLALHDKKAADQSFLELLPIVERAADDERNFVKKGVSWALRGIGHRNAALHRAATSVARRLAASEDSTARWVGKDASRDSRAPRRAQGVRRVRGLQALVAALRRDLPSGEFVVAAHWDAQERLLQTTFTDTPAGPRAMYYLRVELADRIRERVARAWSSPVWLNLAGAN